MLNDHSNYISTNKGEFQNIGILWQNWANNKNNLLIIQKYDVCVLYYIT